MKTKLTCLFILLILTACVPVGRSVPALVLEKIETPAWIEHIPAGVRYGCKLNLEMETKCDLYWYPDEDHYHPAVYTLELLVNDCPFSSPVPEDIFNQYGIRDHYALFLNNSQLEQCGLATATPEVTP